MKKKLYSYDCPSTKRGSTSGIINGCSDGIINLNNLSYKWAYNLWEMMLANTWFPKEVDLTEDARQYRKLLPAEKRLYDKVLSQLIFMDSIQTNNSVDNVNPWITAPEVNMCIVRQSFEEALHSQSYAVMVDSISMNTDEIYEMWRRDEKLKSKNEFIGNVYEKYGQRAIDGDDEAKIYMIIANQCLEGIYFYSGFAGIYVLARAGKMLGSAQMIRFIQRDEVTHLQLFANIYKEIKKENPSLFTNTVIQNIKDMFYQAYELERDWGYYITQEQILGFSNPLIDKFIKYLTNQRLKAIGIEGIFDDEDKNPLTWFESFSSFNEHKTNFFEGNVTNYSKGGISFDDL
ncbi:MAG: ribonucleotide-diphosphate reductase subunit beta [Epsilonproteobacteria bacterium]|nr:ribonucleotide-diphosphate reductase subunit beta [Campylobacterota bacterium]